MVQKKIANIIAKKIIFVMPILAVRLRVHMGFLEVTRKSANFNAKEHIHATKLLVV
jgi:hypothetical protein